MSEQLYPDDVLDLDQYLEDPAVAAQFEDAEARSSLRAALVAQRRSASLTQKDVARAMETTQSSISQFERGSSDPHLSTVQRYARAVGAWVVVEVMLASPSDVPR